MRVYTTLYCLCYCFRYTCCVLLICEECEAPNYDTGDNSGLESDTDTDPNPQVGPSTWAVPATQPSNESTNGSNSQEASSDQQEADAGSGELSDS